MWPIDVTSKLRRGRTWREDTTIKLNRSHEFKTLGFKGRKTIIAGLETVQLLKRDHYKCII